jgi:hypothetical protein
MVATRVSPAAASGGLVTEIAVAAVVELVVVDDPMTMPVDVPSVTVTNPNLVTELDPAVFVAVSVTE